MPSKSSQPNLPRLLLTLVSLASATLIAGTAQAESGFDPQRTVATPHSELKFENINPAIRMATAWGDKSKSLGAAIYVSSWNRRSKFLNKNGF